MESANISLSIFNNCLQYTAMMNDYNPWGKQGGGAPNQDIRRMNIYKEELYPDIKDVRQ